MGLEIGIVGYGYVGKAMYNFFKEHYACWIYDTDRSAIDEAPRAIYGLDDISSCCDLVLICVPTPCGEDGSCNTSIVEEVIRAIDADLIIIKSTVPPGTTDRLKKETGKNIVFSPEYCGESSYWTPYDFHKHVIKTPWFIFGGDRSDTSRCVNYYMTVAGPTKEYRQTDARTAELAKYMENCFYATKITFCYEFAGIAEKAGVDYNELRSLWLLDPRINPMHTAVFQENRRPFSGKCLPKDLSAMVKFAEEIGYDPELLKEVIISNERISHLRSRK